MKRLRKVLWRYVYRKLWYQRRRDKRRVAGICFNCSEPRKATGLRCQACADKYSHVAKPFEEAMPAYWAKHQDIVEHNDQVLQAAWEAEHA